MSREQWGHGYWKGVADAKAGKIKRSFEDEVKFWICHMCLSNAAKDHDRSLYSAREFIARLRFSGLSEKYGKKVYDYIMEHEPYGCYVSGDSNSSWKEDYFVLPYDTSEKWQKELDRITND